MAARGSEQRVAARGSEWQRVGRRRRRTEMKAVKAMMMAMTATMEMVAIGGQDVGWAECGLVSGGWNAGGILGECRWNTR